METKTKSKGRERREIEIYDRKLKSMKRYAPFLGKIVRKLEKNQIKVCKRHFSAAKAFYSLLTEPRVRIKLSNLVKLEALLKKLYANKQKLGIGVHRPNDETEKKESTNSASPIENPIKLDPSTRTTAQTTSEDEQKKADPKESSADTTEKSQQPPGNKSKRSRKRKPRRRRAKATNDEVARQNNGISEKTKLPTETKPLRRPDQNLRMLQEQVLKRNPSPWLLSPFPQPLSNMYQHVVAQSQMAVPSLMSLQALVTNQSPLVTPNIPLPVHAQWRYNHHAKRWVAVGLSSICYLCNTVGHSSNQCPLNRR